MIEGARLLLRRVWPRVLALLAVYLAIYAAAASTFPKQLEDFALWIRLIALVTGPIAIFLFVAIISVIETARWRSCDLSFDWGKKAFEFRSWSPELLLRPRDVEATRTAAGAAQDWLSDHDSLAGYEAKALAQHGTGGKTAYLVGLVLDNPEVRGDPERRHPLSWQVAPGDYSKFLATRSYLHSPQGASDQQLIWERLETNWADALKCAPPSIVAVNISVVSDDLRVLTLQRSNTVATARGMWCVGAHETMNWIDADRPLGENGPETAFTLAERALHEEVRLEPTEYGPILFSWFGLYIPDACAYLYGHVRTKLEATEVTRRIQKSQGSYEVLNAGEMVSWEHYDCKPFQQILAAVRNARPDAAGRRWIEHARDPNQKPQSMPSNTPTQVW